MTALAAPSMIDDLITTQRQYGRVDIEDLARKVATL